MTEKLTLDDCYKYPNTRIKADTKDFKNVFTFTIYSFNSNLSSNQILREENCKLILRSIEQLTDEEKAQLLENHLNDQGRDILKRSSYSYGNFENRLYELDVKQTDYLRSISVDIDNFLKSGKAVKEWLKQ